MHEISLAQGILDIVKKEAERNGLKRVSRIGIRIGDSSHMEPSSFSFCFDMIKKGTLAEDAVLDIEKGSTTDDLQVVYMEGD
ncbi:MAG: hydrogenase maturation nickel metallochaperone HypA [Deltaproteobacteria bacterium]|nr:hydrogenase maturation nickel metallochaperone HypA [Deltaproteobacteria bacterium]